MLAIYLETLLFDNKIYWDGLKVRAKLGSAFATACLFVLAFMKKRPNLKLRFQEEHCAVIN